MANQNPQPSMLTARFDIPAGTPAVGTSYSNVITTQQAYNEIIYVYGLNVQGLGDDGVADSTLLDINWDIQIVSGPNSIPTNDFDFAYIYNRDDKTISFSSPIVITHRQPLQVILERTGAGAAMSQASTFLITLIGELVVMA